jgi:hypothetical protein
MGTISVLGDPRVQSDGTFLARVILVVCSDNSHAVVYHECVNTVGRVARIVPSLSLTESPKQRTIRAIMQLKLGIQEAIPPTTKNLANKYNIFVLCNKCGGMHDMAVFIVLKDGPVEKQSIAQVYKDGNLPTSLTNLSSQSVTCPATGRRSTQKDNHQIFLVPAKN